MGKYIAMNFKQLCQERYSVRNFLDKDIEKKKINYILECAQLAPSASNFQPWKFYIVSKKESKEKFKSVYSREWFQDASVPLYIVICKDTSESWKRINTDSKDHGDIDIAIVAEHVALAVTEIGLGACWICNFDPQKLRDFLQLPSNQEPVVIFPIGYIDEESSKVPVKKRKNIDEFVHWVE